MQSVGPAVSTQGHTTVQMLLCHEEQNDMRLVFDCQRCGRMQAQTSVTTNPRPLCIHSCSPTKLKTKLHGLSPRANYTDRAAAAGRRN